MKIILETQNPITYTNLLNSLSALNLQGISLKCDPPMPALNSIHKPLAESLDIDALKLKQGYTGVHRETFDALIAEINLQEPLTELLEQLKA
jgi:hypothetical protein